MATEPELLALLAVQATDTAIDQLQHRLGHLPAKAELAGLTASLAELERSSAELRGQREELGRQQRRLEDEVAQFEDRIATADKALYGGGITSPKELQALQEEIASLGRRKGELEDQILGLMVESEPLDGELAGRDAERDRLDAEAARLRAAIAEEESSIEADLAELRQRRTAEVVPVSDGVLAEYERLRAGLSGIGAARLVGNRCDGCHLTLPAVEVDRIRREPDDAVLHCSECGRILVRT